MSETQNEKPKGLLSCLAESFKYAGARKRDAYHHDRRKRREAREERIHIGHAKLTDIVKHAYEEYHVEKLASNCSVVGAKPCGLVQEDYYNKLRRGKTVRSAYKGASEYCDKRESIRCKDC